LEKKGLEALKKKKKPSGQALQLGTDSIDVGQSKFMRRERRTTTSQKAPKTFQGQLQWGKALKRNGGTRGRTVGRRNIDRCHVL